MAYFIISVLLYLIQISIWLWKLILKDYMPQLLPISQLSQANNNSNTTDSRSKLNPELSSDLFTHFNKQLTLVKSKSCRGSSLCGNGVVDPSEQCDDENMATNEGCNNLCQKQENNSLHLSPGIIVAIVLASLIFVGIPIFLAIKQCWNNEQMLTEVKVEELIKSEKNLADKTGKIRLQTSRCINDRIKFQYIAPFLTDFQFERWQLWTIAGQNIRDILINQQKTISKMYGAIFNLAKMFKNKYFIRNPRLNRQMIDNLNRISENSERLLQLSQKLEQLKAKERDEKEEIKTNDESEQTVLSKSRTEDSFDVKDEPAQSHQQVSDERIGEDGPHLIDLESRELPPPEHLQNQSCSKRMSYLIKSKQLIQKQFLVQARFIQNALHKKISLKLKLLQIEELLVEKLQKECENEPELWEICSGILYEVFATNMDESEKQNPHLIEECKMEGRKSQRTECMEWIS